MQYLMFVTILAVTTGSYFASIHAAPSWLKYAPEVLSLVFALYIAVAGAGNRFRYLAPRYWLVFGALALVVAGGVLGNSIAPGPLLQGWELRWCSCHFQYISATRWSRHSG
jgi:hypothetical protein